MFKIQWIQQSTVSTIYMRVWMVLNATFNNISVISWRSVLLVEETGECGENHRPVASHWQTLSHNVVSSSHRLSRAQTHNFTLLLVIGTVLTDCIGSYKSNYHMITTMTNPLYKWVKHLFNHPLSTCCSCVMPRCA